MRFDHEPTLEYFFDEDPDERDKVGIVRGVLRLAIPINTWFVLVGTAAYINHISPQRKSPNVSLVFNPTRGFNRGSFQVVVNTRNKQGLGATKILRNSGVGCDFTVVCPKPAAYV